MPLRPCSCCALSRLHPACAAALVWLTQHAHGMHTCPRGHQTLQRWRHLLCPPNLSEQCVRPPWNASSPAGQPESMSVLCRMGAPAQQACFQLPVFKVEAAAGAMTGCQCAARLGARPWLSQAAMKRQLACTMLALYALLNPGINGNIKAAWHPSKQLKPRGMDPGTLWDHLHGGSPKDELKGPMGPH